LHARQEETVNAVIEAIATVSQEVIVTENQEVIATVKHVAETAIAEATVEAWREEAVEDHLPEISASGAATQVIGKNFITNYKWMEKDEIEGVDFHRSERVL
jgi:hypothetical protein